jgi:hypothetical protein
MRLPVTPVAMLITVVGLALGASSRAAEPTPAKPVQENPAQAPAAPAQKPADVQAGAKAEPKPDDKVAAPAAAEKSADANQAEAKPDVKSPADAKASPQRFIPSEQVRADFDVSFPIDI